MPFKTGNKAVILLLALLIAASAAALLYRAFSSGGERLYALVSVDGEHVASIPLSEGEQLLDLSENGGKNVLIEVKDGRARFKFSDCPDKICINAGWLSRDMDVAVCMPNRTAVTISASPK